MLTVGSLFAGIGGFDLGLERAGFEITWQVENNAYCRRVLQKHWPSTPCHADIKTIDWQHIPNVDVVCGGFPCQPFSCAGKQRGQHDDRYLWPEVVRCLTVLRPAWFLGENVPGLLHVGINRVLDDLEALGYQPAVLGIPACAVDAPHLRQRVWIVAHHDRALSIQSPNEIPAGRYATDIGGEDVADAKNANRRRTNGTNDGRRRDSQTRRCGIESGRFQYWLPEPNVGRVAHGVPARVDRLRAIGNAIVPQIAEALGRMILDAEATAAGCR